MKIILLKDVKKLGKSGNVLNVKDGYGVFLINKKDAVLATNNSIDRLAREIEEKSEQEALEIRDSEKTRKRLELLKVSFKVKTGTQDRVFGSISPKQIVEELQKQGYNIDKRQIKITKPLSTLGFHNVDIELHKKVKATIKIELVK